MTKDLCNKCGSCCKNIKADINSGILYWDGIKTLDKEFLEMLVHIKEDVYTCKFLLNNLCTNPNKPDLCKDYPSTPFMRLEKNCSYNGEIFVKEEKIKQKIRRLKEEIIHYNALLETIKDKREQSQLKKIILNHEKFIDKYKSYGSENW